MSSLACGLRERPAALPPALRKGCAFPIVRPTNLLRAAGRLSLAAARRRKKKGGGGGKGRALPRSGAAEPLFALA